LEKGLARMPDEVAPYKILPYAMDAIKSVAVARISLFSERNQTTAHAEGRGSA
jgi:fructose-bisphosphate aldolase class II